MATRLNNWKCFGGFVSKWSHQSVATKTEMKFSVFLPSIALASSAQQQRVPVLYWLSGLTCNEDNMIQKAGAMQACEDAGIALVCPDTSPRGTDIEGEHDAYDFGSGAGFYVNATQPLWKENYNMYDYITKELPALVQSEFHVNDKQSITGHSMGGHGALISYLKNPGQYQSVSAFSPICNPTQGAWGQKAFAGYLGDEDKEAWKKYDATELVKGYSGPKDTILIDQGLADDFYPDQLLSENFRQACKQNEHPLDLRLQEDYDHSYWFIATFINDHIQHHAKHLKE